MVAMSTSRPRARVVGVGLGLGALVWALSIPLTGMREPFDGSIAYYAAATFLAGALAAIPSPRHWPLAILAVHVGQHLYAFAAYPDTRAWFLFGLVVNALLPTWAFAAAGALLTYAVSRVSARASGRREP